MVIGTPDSWDPTISFSAKDSYESCTWSPCGRFVAAQTKKTVEIRNQLTFELLTVLQSTKNTPLHLPTGPLAYSPDGRSLACGFFNAIVIWDIQTGGVAKEIECSGVVSLVWSLDGRTIATALGYGNPIPGVKTYDVASGAQLFMEEFELEIVCHLWAYEKSFRFMTTMSRYGDPTLKISISEIGPTLVKIEALSLTMGVTFPSLSTITFSPPTHRLSILGLDMLRVLDIRSTNCLLEARGHFTSSQFSPDGCLFAASHLDGIRIWKYTSGSYTLWEESLLRYLQFPTPNKHSLRFPPTSSSILFIRRAFIQVRRLRDLPTTPQTRRQYAAISRSGNRIATAHESENTVTLIDPHSQAPSQSIDTGVGVEGLVITGNVLLVASSEKVMAWLLTGEGMVDRVSGKRADHNDSIWTISSLLGHCKLLGFRVEGQVGVIKSNNISPFIYHTETGDVLERAQEPQHSSCPWVSFYQLSDCREYHYLRCHNPSQCDTPTEDGWLISHTAMGEVEWAMDPEGRHRFWVPVEWRKPWKRENWHHDITTLFSNIGDQLVMIKF